MGGAAVAHSSLTDVDAQTDSGREQGETVQCRHALRAAHALFRPLLVLFPYKSHKLWSSVQREYILNAESVWQTRESVCEQMCFMGKKKTVVFVS